MLTITHTHTEGTLISGTSRGDGTAEILKTNGWKWGRSISSWYVPYSRDRLPKTWIITQTVKALETAGYSVETQISLDHRTTAEVEEGKQQRAEDRADALAAKVERKQAAYEAASDRFRLAAKSLPPMGQPILVGHHSEAAHRRALDKADTTARKAYDAYKEVGRAEQRAKTAAGATSRRYDPATVANRIDKIAAEIRKINRILTGERRYKGQAAGSWFDESAWETIKPTGDYLARLEALKAEQEDQLTYWQQIRDDQKANGIRSYGPQDIHKGDYVLQRDSWYEVVRVNRKTVTVSYQWSDTFSTTNTIPFAEISDVKRANHD